MAGIDPKERHAVSRDFYDWILEARSVIDEHFPRESAQAHSAMILETARTLMLAERLDTVSARLERVAETLSEKD